MSPVETAFTIGVTVFNVACMIVAIVSWSNACYLERKARRHREMIFEAMMAGPYGRMEWKPAAEKPAAEKPDA